MTEKQSERLQTRLVNALSRLCHRYLNKFPVYKAIHCKMYSVIDKNRTYMLKSELIDNYEKRREITRTLNDIGYERNNDKWTVATVVGFIHEAMLYYTRYSTDDAYKEFVSKRYNVSPNRFRTQIALFFRNQDRYYLQDYFTKDEVLLWKYRDTEKLEADLRGNKISVQDLMLLVDLDMLKYDNKHNTYNISK